MIFTLFLVGFLIGCLLVIPLGPVAILIIRRRISSGFMAAVLTGLGSSFADMLYALLAALSASFVAGLIERNTFLFSLIGGSFVVFFGCVLLFGKTSNKDINTTSAEVTYWADFLTGFLMVIINPSMLLVYSGIFAKVHLAYNLPDNFILLWFVLGAFLGGMTWWFVLSAIVGKIQHKIDIRKFRIFNIISGFGMLLLGVFLLLKSFLFH